MAGDRHAPPACPRCGELGHLGRRDGCSRTYLAAQLVLTGRATITQAARRHRVAKQSVCARLIKLGRRVYPPKGTGLQRAHRRVV